LLKCAEQEQEEDVTGSYELLQQELEQATKAIATSMKRLELKQQTSQFFGVVLTTLYLPFNFVRVNIISNSRH